MAKWVSLIVILCVYVVLFVITTCFVYYTRVVHMPFGSVRLGAGELYDTVYAVINVFIIWLKNIVYISCVIYFSYRSKTSTVIGITIGIAVGMMITSVMGGKIAMIFPNGYMQFYNTTNDCWIPLMGSIVTTGMYSIFCNYRSVTMFKKMEF